MPLEPFPTIPIFVITCDRLTALTKSLESYRQCLGIVKHEIIICDNGSTYKPMVDYLKDLASMGIRIYRFSKMEHQNDHNRIDFAIKDYFKSHPLSNYVVTDCDVALECPSTILRVLSKLLDMYKDNPQVTIAGPSLRIDDIPDYYPLKKLVLQKHNTFWHSLNKRKKSFIYDANNPKLKPVKVEYIFAPIDTTFGMCRAGSTYTRKQKGIRTLPPFHARHLDWYLDPNNIPPDQQYYTKHANKRVAHWTI